MPAVRLLLLALLTALPGLASAQYYDLDLRNGAVSIAWPEADPVWEMVVVRPSESSATDGSGLELRDVTYNGRRVLGRAHIPIVNVQYDGTCGCYRDWSDDEAEFLTEPAAGGAFFVDATPGTVQTTCDFAGEVDPLDDQGDLKGIAAEDYGDRLVITSQYRAGWYRYRVRWTFWPDGRMQPTYAFGHVFNFCTETGRNHHAYWRFDFDIEGADDDYVVESSPAETLTFETEARRTHGEGVEWGVYDRASGRGYVLTPGPETALPVDTFSYADAIVLRYRPDELDDGAGFVGGGDFCAVNFEIPGPPSDGDRQPPLLDGEAVFDTDVVLWYRTGTRRLGEGDDTCRVLGPTLTPVGDWTAVADEGDAPALPQTAELTAAYPNPFERATTVRFRLTESRPVTLTLVDDLGRTLRTVYEGTPAAGRFVTVQMEAGDLPSGAYTLRLAGEGVSQTTRVVLLR